MSAGGYIFRKINLTYDPNTNGLTIFSWARAIHEARCQAFYDAAKAYYESIGEPYGWYSLASGQLGNMYPIINLGSNPLFVTQDIHSSWNDETGEPNNDYPALMTVFLNEVTGSYYCIITYNGFNSYTTYASDYSKGLYIPESSLTKTNSGHVCSGGSCSHCFAKSGGITTAPVDIKSSSFLINNCTHIMSAYSPVYSYPSGRITDSYSLLYDRANNGPNSSNLVGKTFQFGYAVKGEQIISMMRNVNSGRWLWSIIGDIFGTTMSNEDKVLVGCLVNDYDTSSNGEISTQAPNAIYSVHSYGRTSFCKSNGDLYRPANNYQIFSEYSRGTNYSINPSVRTNNTIPDDTLYNAVTVGAYTSSFSSTTSDTGVDGNGNGCKGFIDTDLLRMVSAGVCQNTGTLFNGGNFISMKSPQSEVHSGWLLGWDPSNESIM